MHIDLILTKLALTALRRDPSVLQNGVVDIIDYILPIQICKMVNLAWREFCEGDSIRFRYLAFCGRTGPCIGISEKCDDNEKRNAASIANGIVMFRSRLLVKRGPAAPTRTYHKPHQISYGQIGVSVRLILIGGAQRSGTTLVQTLLSSALGVSVLPKLYSE